MKKHYTITMKQDGEVDSRHLSEKARKYLESIEPIAVYKVDWLNKEGTSADRYDVVEDGYTTENLTFEELDKYLCECWNTYEAETAIKRYYVTTNAYNTVIYVNDNRMVALNEAENHFETIEEAKSADYSGVDGCDSLEEIACMVNAKILPLDTSDFESMEEF